MVETNQSEVIYPKPRSLDSVYVRVERNGKGQILSFTDLIEPEQQKYLATLDREGLERMCMLMAGAVRGIGDLFGLSFVGMEEIEC
jgi:hypothetical protein